VLIRPDTRGDLWGVFNCDALAHTKPLVALMAPLYWEPIYAELSPCFSMQAISPDVHKHAALVLTLNMIAKKASCIACNDTHAGSAFTDLDDERAAKTAKLMRVSANSGPIGQPGGSRLASCLRR